MKTLDENDEEHLKEITDTRKVEEVSVSIFGVPYDHKEATTYMNSYFPNNSFEEFMVSTDLY